jgi:hypothetical protein
MEDNQVIAMPAYGNRPIRRERTDPRLSLSCFDHQVGSHASIQVFGERIRECTNAE